MSIDELFPFNHLDEGARAAVVRDSSNLTDRRKTLLLRVLQQAVVNAYWDKKLGYYH